MTHESIRFENFLAGRSVSFREPVLAVRTDDVLNLPLDICIELPRLDRIPCSNQSLKRVEHVLRDFHPDVLQQPPEYAQVRLRHRAHGVERGEHQVGLLRRQVEHGDADLLVLPDIRPEVPVHELQLTAGEAHCLQDVHGPDLVEYLLEAPTLRFRVRPPVARVRDEVPCPDGHDIHDAVPGHLNTSTLNCLSWRDTRTQWSSN